MDLEAGRQQRPQGEDALVSAARNSKAEMRNHPTATIEEWIEASAVAGLIVDTKNHTQRNLFHNSKRALIAANWVACNETLAWIPSRTEEPAQSELIPF